MNHNAPTYFITPPRECCWLAPSLMYACMSVQVCMDPPCTCASMYVRMHIIRQLLCDYVCIIMCIMCMCIMCMCVQVMDLVLLHFDPEAVILQSGADSLSGDRLGCFNLSLEGRPSSTTRQTDRQWR
eukprot:GHVU01197290.1.p1 GENE.GHVU01197290.1~~GHVU01197290.1.p1  ORF type:complete len:127 (+),score=8.82 GHVU01197290.1:358-738(+)